MMKLLLALSIMAGTICPSFYITPACVTGIWQEPECVACCYDFPDGNGYVADYPEESGLEVGDSVMLIADEKEPGNKYDDELIAVITMDGCFFMEEEK